MKISQLKRSHLITLLLVVTFIVFGFKNNTSYDDNSNYIDDYKEIMIQMKDYTLSIGELMPKEKYDFRPTEEVRSFAEQLKHIGIILDNQGKNVTKFKQFDTKESIAENKAYEKKSLSKKEILTNLSASFDNIISSISSMDDETLNKKYSFPFAPKNMQSMRTITMFIRDHITHHRAQAIVYLRLNNIEPTFYKPF